MKINEFFDKGYYINLDRRVDRKYYIENILKENNLLEFCDRISAVDGLAEPNPILKQHYCSASHHKVFSEAKKDNVEKVVVFEDDFSLYNSKKFKGLQNIEKGLTQLSKINDWDIVYFGGYIFDKEIKQISENLLKVDTILALHGYGISKTGMEKLNEHKPFTDCQLDGWIGQRSNINKYVIYPFSSYQIENPSDLDASGNTPNLQHWKEKYITPDKVII